MIFPDAKEVCYLAKTKVNQLSGENEKNGNIFCINTPLEIHF